MKEITVVSLEAVHTHTHTQKRCQSMIPLYEQQQNKIKDLEYQNITTGTEFETGRIIDGKKEYGIIVDCGSLPNNTSKSKSLPITLSHVNITKIETLCKSGSGVIQNFEFYSGFNGLYLSTSQNTVIFATKVDGSAYNLHVTLYYTKS